MQTKNYFFEHYDEIMPKICAPYQRFLEIAASAIPDGARSVLDLGIGTGNLSLEVKKRIPGIKIYGIDLGDLLQKAKIKIPDAELYCRDILGGDLPQTDYVGSSLTAHHFPPESSLRELLKIAGISRGFINFDLAIFPGQTFEDLLRRCSNFAERSFSREKVRNIEKEMRQNDHPMPLEEIISLFPQEKFDFKILATENPYVVYRVFNKSM